MGKMWQWTGSTWERCGSRQGMNGKDVAVDRVYMGKMWLWTGYKWERCGSGQGMIGKDVAVDRV